jgi:hypothetical protein
MLTKLGLEDASRHDAIRTETEPQSLTCGKC